jgi:PD-(D/E)XK endonuclease
VQDRAPPQRRGLLQDGEHSGEYASRLYPAYDGEADLFLVYCPDTERVYAVSVDEAASSEGKLRVAPAANGQAKGIRWASDHELPA